MNNQKLSRAEIFTYLFPSIGLAAIGLTFFVYLPKFYIDVVQISAAWFGGVLIATRVFDAFLDPIIGRLSDRYANRRKIWLLVGAIPFGLSFIALCTPDSFLNFLPAEYSFLILVVAFYALWSFFSVPYQALGISLTDNYHEKTKVLGYREAGLLFGTILASLLPFLYEYSFGTADNFEYLLYVAFLYSAIIIIGVSLIQKKLHPLPLKTETELGKSKLIELIKFKPFSTLLATYLLTSFGSTLSGATIFFFIENVLESERATQYIFIYFLCSFLLIPFWIYWSKKIDKKKAWLQSLILSEAAFVGIIFLGPGDGPIYLTMIIISSLGLGGAVAIPASLQADVAQYDAAKNGKSRDAELVGYWSFAKKLSAAVAAGAAFPVLDAIGYLPNQAQSPEVLAAIKIVYCGVPALCYLGAIYFAWKYPLTKESFST